MAYVQLISPNTGIACRPGWCLEYVQNAYRTGWAGASATDAWNKAQKKHADDNFPNDVDVPVYFAMAGVPEGHIVIRMRDGSVYSTSSPTATKPVHHSSLQALYNYYGAGKLTLRGWSEDLNGTLLIKAGGKTMDFDDGVALYRSVLHREPENSQAAQSNVGLKPSTAMDNMRGSEEWLTQNHILLVAYPDAVRAIGALNQQLATMSSRPSKDEIAALQTQLTDADAKAQKALAEYEEAKAKADKLQAQADTDKAAGDSFLRRLGQFISQFLPGSK